MRIAMIAMVAMLMAGCASGKYKDVSVRFTLLGGQNMYPEQNESRKNYDTVVYDRAINTVDGITSPTNLPTAGAEAQALVDVEVPGIVDVEVGPDLHGGFQLFVLEVDVADVADEVELVEPVE